MALILADRVLETTTTTGTGSVTLLGASLGYQSFAVVGNSNTTYYCIADLGGSSWEVGIGTYSTTGPTLARTTVLSSSNSGALVNFTAGTKNVFCTYPSSQSVYEDASGNVSPLGTIASGVWNGTAIGVPYGGTGLTSLATGYVPYGNGTSPLSSSSSLTFASSTLTAPIVNASNGLVVNSATVSASYSLPSGSNAMSVGPMTIASGQSVTVASGQRWVIL